MVLEPTPSLTIHSGDQAYKTHLLGEPAWEPESDDDLDQYTESHERIIAVSSRGYTFYTLETHFKLKTWNFSFQNNNLQLGIGLVTRSVVLLHDGQSLCKVLNLNHDSMEALDIFRLDQHSSAMDSFHFSWGDKFVYNWIVVFGNNFSGITFANLELDNQYDIHFEGTADVSHIAVCDPYIYCGFEDGSIMQLTRIHHEAAKCRNGIPNELIAPDYLHYCSLHTALAPAKCLLTFTFENCTFTLDAKGTIFRWKEMDPRQYFQINFKEPKQVALRLNFVLKKRLATFLMSINQLQLTTCLPQAICDQILTMVILFELGQKKNLNMNRNQSVENYKKKKNK
jgi:hypothetical protein